VLRQNIVNLYAHGSNVDLLVAEKDVILTYVLKVLDEADDLNIVFKGGTCLRKCYFGGLTRFSEDLDFQDERNNTLRDTLYRLFHDAAHYGIRFSFTDDDWYETSDSLGVDVHYSHEWNRGSQFKFQVSFRGNILLPPSPLSVRKENYSKWLEFPLPIVACMDLNEIIAEKIRACYQRSTVRDLHDLYFFSRRPFNNKLIRLLVVLKFWDVHDMFNPVQFLRSVSQGNYNWHDLNRLIRKDAFVDPQVIIKGIGDRFSFLQQLDDDEQLLINDAKKHKQLKLQNSLVEIARRLHNENNKKVI